MNARTANTDDRRAPVPHFLVVISSIVATQPPTTPSMSVAT